jgi:hypothetical protein
MRMKEYFSHTAFVVFIYVLLVGVYYTSSHLHVKVCTPWSLMGFIKSPFLIETLECRAIKWLFTYSHEYIHSLWILFSTFLIKMILDFFAQIKEGVNGKTTPSVPHPLY